MTRFTSHYDQGGDPRGGADRVTVDQWDAELLVARELVGDAGELHVIERGHSSLTLRCSNGEALYQVEGWADQGQTYRCRLVRGAVWYRALP